MDSPHEELILEPIGGSSFAAYSSTKKRKLNITFLTPEDDGRTRQLFACWQSCFRVA